jgi:hypothetical protein
MYEEMWSDQEEWDGEMPDMPDMSGLVPDLPLDPDYSMTLICLFLSILTNCC